MAGGVELSKLALVNVAHRDKTERLPLECCSGFQCCRPQSILQGIPLGTTYLKGEIKE